MKKVLLFTAILLISSASVHGQFIRFTPGNDTTRSVTLEGYADVYYGFDFNEPSDGNRPYSVSQSRHNEFNINLAYLSLKYNSERARVSLTPGFGTYMNANYAAEHQSLQNIIEAYIGVKPFKNHNIWIDAGVISSPYTTENAVAHDQLLYTRSLAAEYSPYYLTGVRATVPLSKKLNLYLYLLNGWQVIQDVNSPMSFGSALEWKPTDKATLSWSTYAGNENSAAQPTYHGRLFSDLFFVYNPNQRWSLSADVYIGWQQITDSMNRKSTPVWYQANVNARYYLNKSQSISGRAEYFNDDFNVLAVPVTGARAFNCKSLSLGYNLEITDHVCFHVEGRYFFSAREIYFNADGNPASTDMLLICGLTARF